MSSLARHVRTEYTYHELVNQQVALGPRILLRIRYTESLFKKKKINNPVVHKNKYFPGNFRPFTKQTP